ncbi:DUF1513 domain-containing protein [Mesorhizobium marinum]|uniref:DUF1513 domain-containing protein n=1 Tax=Mesorhizobium marinum TaxID=3228790 RepID=UPI0034663E27
MIGKRSGLLDRRDFLKAAGAAFLSSLGAGARAEALAADAVFATAYRRRDGAYGAAVLSEAGKVLLDVELPERGHDIAFDPVSGRSAVFARQPGTFFVVLDHGGRSAPQTIASAPGRHFFGHGVFSPDGALLYATENDFENAAGMIGVYDATSGFARVGEFPTHGIGPHELLLLGDGRTIAVANGGIETHPDFGRAKLNLTTMKPSYVLIDRESGSLVEKHELAPDLHQLSIRHMDVDDKGAVWFGCQHEGPSNERPALVGRAARGKELELIALPPGVLSGFRNYIGSVAANRRAGTIAVTSPQGNLCAVIETASAKVVATRRLTEVCGVAPDGVGFMTTTGTGEIVDPAGRVSKDAEHVWDNHVVWLGA